MLKVRCPGEISVDVFESDGDNYGEGGGNKSSKVVATDTSHFQSTFRRFTISAASVPSHMLNDTAVQINK